MNKYIDADKLIAKIERLKERYGSIIPNSITAQNYQEGRLIGYEDALYEIKKSLQQEQPEVDLKKEVKSYIKDNFTITDEVAQIPEEDRRYSMWEDDMVAFAKHFYKLGRTRKEK